MPSFSINRACWGNPRKDLSIACFGFTFFFRLAKSGKRSKLFLFFFIFGYS
ncbi:hypothetical protein Fmac_000683 [Flemingia macrophylla]|uniref:Uncharacterized protein n=1 Tax=Flemingia macrophylla TaxID=520843 RepID=A0ABD1NGJ6_9FABA